MQPISKNRNSNNNFADGVVAEEEEEAPVLDAELPKEETTFCRMGSTARGMETQ